MTRTFNHTSEHDGIGSHKEYHQQRLKPTGRTSSGSKLDLELPHPPSLTLGILSPLKAAKKNKGCSQPTVLVKIGTNPEVIAPEHSGDIAI